MQDRKISPTGESLRVNTIGRYLKNEFGRKMVKLALDGGFTCPNRDGRVGTGGCSFCSSSGSGDFASDIEGQIALLSRKWPDSGHLAYFQNHTNTYAPVEILRERYNRALSAPGIEGIAIATRPDCLPADVLDLLDELNQKHFLWVELGLQTIHEETAENFGRGYALSVFDEAMEALNARGIRTVVHLIFGLPGETREQMMDSVRYVAKSGAWGIKFHLLNVVKDSRLAVEQPDYVPFETMEEYVDLVCDAVEILPPEMVVHRLTGDVPMKTLIAPVWSYRKRTVLNNIFAELTRRDTWQGCRLDESI